MNLQILKLMDFEPLLTFFLSANANVPGHQGRLLNLSIMPPRSLSAPGSGWVHQGRPRALRESLPCRFHIPAAIIFTALILDI